MHNAEHKSDPLGHRVLRESSPVRSLTVRALRLVVVTPSPIDDISVYRIPCDVLDRPERARHGGTIGIGAHFPAPLPLWVISS